MSRCDVPTEIAATYLHKRRNSCRILATPSFSSLRCFASLRRNEALSNCLARPNLTNNPLPARQRGIASLIYWLSMTEWNRL